MICAVSDIHSPLYFEMFLKALEAKEQEQEPQLLLLAGDICGAGNIEQYKNILSAFQDSGWNCPIIACFGNTEFEQQYDKIKEICGFRIKFLNDEALTIKIDKKEIGIAGSKGCLDAPTFWQMKNIKNIREFYAEKLEKIARLLAALKTEIKILLTHYAPTYKTLVGEKPEHYGSLGCKKLEQVLMKTKTTLAIHGHAHRGMPYAFLHSSPIFNLPSIPIYNVALPLNKKIVEIDLEKGHECHENCCRD